MVHVSAQNILDFEEFFILDFWIRDAQPEVYVTQCINSNII
jgi:hypothetical protein